MRLAPKHQNLSPPNRNTSRLIPALLAVAGILLLLYPVFATQWNNYRQNQITSYYAQKIQEPQRSQALEASLAAARRYNAETPGAPILDPWLSRVSRANNPYQEYLAQLNVLDQMGQLLIPKIGVNLPIYHGTEAKTLERGVGHLYGSSLPVGGLGTHAVLTGHTGLTTATLFDHLDQLKIGDDFFLNVAGLHMKYVVRSVIVVEPSEIESLRSQPGKDLVTLITCTPYGINSHRLLVTGERAPLGDINNRMFTAGFIFIWSWWMIGALIATTLALLVMLWWLHAGRGKRRQTRDRRRNKNQAKKKRHLATGPDTKAGSGGKADPGDKATDSGGKSDPGDKAGSGDKENPARYPIENPTGELWPDPLGTPLKERW